MTNKKIGSVMIREIIRMKHNGFSNSKISQSLGKARTTILKHLSVIEVSGLKSKELLKLSEEDLFELFEVPNGISVSNREPILADLHAFFPYVEKELKRVGVIRSILWKEYKEKQPEGLMYSRFCEHYSQWNKKSEGLMPTNHKAAEKLFIDYPGKKLHIIDRETGEIKPVEVFVATLVASQYT